MPHHESEGHLEGDRQLGRVDLRHGALDAAGEHEEHERAEEQLHGAHSLLTQGETSGQTARCDLSPSDDQARGARDADGGELGDACGRIHAQNQPASPLAVYT